MLSIKVPSITTALVTFCVSSIVAFGSPSVSVADNPVVSWTIYHSWNPQQDFVRRGSLIWSGGSGEDQQTASTTTATSVGSGNMDVDNILTVVNDVTLTGQAIREMLDYGWYHVRIVPDNISDSDDVVMGTVPACTLRRANFKDQFDITLPRSSVGGRQDPITSLSYMPLVSPLAPKTCEDYPTLEADLTRTFTSKATAQLDTPAMTIKNILPQSKPPPGVAFSKKAQQQAASRKRASATAGDVAGATGDSSPDDDGGEGMDAPEPVAGVWGFLQRYWYILLPITIMQIMSPQPEPPQPSAGPEGQPGTAATTADTTQGGTASAATAASLAPTGGSTPSSSDGGTKGNRRGKRS
jgi:hypothetical protein